MRLPGLLLLALVGAQPAVAQLSTEESSALSTVQEMFKAMRTRDTALLRSLFEPGARLTGIRTRADGAAFVQVINLDQWVQYVARDPRPDWTERAFDPRIQVQGTLAQIWAEYDFHFGQTFSHCGVDAVQLLKLDGRWLIVSIADTFQKQGCPDRGKP
jgi:Putative lumazine-binding